MKSQKFVLGKARAPAGGLALGAMTLMTLMTLMTPAAQAQQATERYIPLGQSPGISGRTAMMGTVVGFGNGVLTMSSPAYPAPQQVRVSSETLIWLDRNPMRQSNVRGSVADLQPGRRIEIHFVDPASRQAAAWIKVEVGATN